MVIQAYERQRKRHTTLCADPITGKVLQEVAGIGVIVNGDRFVACDLDRKEVVTYDLETSGELSSFRMKQVPRSLNTVTARTRFTSVLGNHQVRRATSDVNTGDSNFRQFTCLLGLFPSP